MRRVTLLQLIATSIVMPFWLNCESAGASTKNLVRKSEGPIHIDIMREHSGKDCNSGYISVGGNIIAYTLERPYNDNNPVLFSAIPTGTYPGRLRYDHSDRWRVELNDVPKRTHVQIHVGNKIDDSTGCVLIGKSLGNDLCTLNGSKEAYKTFKEAVYAAVDEGAIPPEIGVMVTIHGTGP